MSHLFSSLLVKLLKLFLLVVLHLIIHLHHHGRAVAAPCLSSIFHVPLKRILVELRSVISGPFLLLA